MSGYNNRAVRVTWGCRRAERGSDVIRGGLNHGAGKRGEVGGSGTAAIEIGEEVNDFVIILERLVEDVV